MFDSFDYNLTAVCLIVWALVGVMLWILYIRCRFELRNRTEMVLFLLCGPICWLSLLGLFLKRVISRTRVG